MQPTRNSHRYENPNPNPRLSPQVTRVVLDVARLHVLGFRRIQALRPSGPQAQRATHRCAKSRLEGEWSKATNEAPHGTAPFLSQADFPSANRK